MTHSLRSILAASLVLSIAAVALAGQSVSIRLHDGSRWRGEIHDRVDLTYAQRGVEIHTEATLVGVSEYYITFEIDLAGTIRRQTIFTEDIVALKTLGDSAVVDVTAGRPVSDVNHRKGPGQSRDVDRNTPGVFVLPLKGRVGLDLRHEEMEKIAEEADKYGPGQIIVLLIDSGGGAVTEMEKIHETLMDIKKRHRLVAWIKQAISAACATAMHCDEIYFMTNGTAGAMTAYAGTTAWSGKELKEWQRRAGDWMEAGGRSRYIAEAMIHSPNLLSYDKDPVTGEVTFYNDLSGETILSRSGENLVFTASTALDSGFSDGTATSEQELAELLDLPEWYEISDYGRKIAESWQKNVKTAQRELRLLQSRLSYAGTGSGDPIEILGARIKIYEKFVRWHDRCPNCTQMAGLAPKEQLQREIQVMRKDLGDLKRRRR